MKKTFLAIIPARGGSKRLPNKNILPLNGKPLISYSINAALNSKYIDEVIVTSDSKKILHIAKKYGANIIKRPSSLASDTSSTFDALKHAIELYKQNGKQFDYIILLQPTSPLRKSKHINEAVKMLFKRDAKAIVSITKAIHSPLWSFKAKKNKKLDKIFESKFMKKRSQDLPVFYNVNGSIYICDTKQLLKEETILISNDIYGYEMSNKYSVDIDDAIDFKLAQILLGEGNGKKEKKINRSRS